MNRHVGSTVDTTGNLLSIPEAAKVLGVSVGTMRRYIRFGQIPAVHLPGRVLLRPEHVEEYIEDRTTVGGSS